jgi:class 3 adenylate cyclase
LKIGSDSLVKLFRLCFRNAWIAGLTIVSLTTIAAHTLLGNVSVIEVSEHYFSDLRVALLSPPRPQSSRIAVILLNEESLDEVSYRSPIDRALLVELIDVLEQRRVAAIGLNVRFDRSTETAKDRLLYDRLRNIDIPVVISMVSDQTGYSDRQIAYSRKYLSGLHTGLSLIYRDTIDHTVRSSLLRLTLSDKTYKGFSATLAEIVGIKIPQTDQIHIDYRVGPDSWTPPFPVYSAKDVKKLDPTALVNRIVLIGPDLGHTRRLRTPFSVLNREFAKDLPGVIIEAHVLSQLIENRSMKIPGTWGKSLFIILMAAMGCFLSLLRVNLLTKLLLPLALLPLAWLGALMMFIFEGLVIPVVTPTIAFIIAMIITAFWQWRNEMLQRERVHSVFGKFLAPTVVDEILQSPDDLDLTGEVREITFLFTDLEGFTRLTETTQPQVMVGLVNNYLEEACDIVMAHGGTIDKIVGDALHVMFNAPLWQGDHAQRAVLCALELDSWSEEFRERHRQQGIDLGVTRIGINTGKCIVGNFGGKSRFDYTAHGDAINSAARLEAINKRLGTTICVSESTVLQCQDIYFRWVATLVLYGKSEGIRAYTPLKEKSLNNTKIIIYEKAYELLTEGNPNARALFDDLYNLYPEDSLIALHIEQIKQGSYSTTMSIRSK